MIAPSLTQANLTHTGRIAAVLRRPLPRRAAPGNSRGLAPPADLPIPGLNALWNITKGDPRVTIAMIDGPVDMSHPCFAGVSLQTLHLKGQAPVVCRSKSQGSCNHGTQIASLLFAQHGCGPVRGIAPGCRGLIIPIFRDHPLVAGAVLPSSQTDLARAIDLARDHGAHIINISSGQTSVRGRAEPELATAVRRCAESGVLIVSAAGNDGGDALHVPAALPEVLVVGALDGSGQPAEFSNYGSLYRSHGVLAPGENLRVASNGGGFEVQSGTSVRHATGVWRRRIAAERPVQDQRGSRPAEAERFARRPPEERAWVRSQGSHCVSPLPGRHARRRAGINPSEPR